MPRGGNSLHKPICRKEYFSNFAHGGQCCHPLKCKTTKRNMRRQSAFLYDYQTFHAQRFGGISRYFCEIAGHACHTTPEIAVRFSAHEQYIRHSDIKGHTSIPMRPYKIMSGWFRDINRKASIKAIRKETSTSSTPHTTTPTSSKRCRTSPSCSPYTT